MKPHPRPIPPEMLAELEALAARPDSEIDLTDMPEITDWTGAVRGMLHDPELRAEAVRLDRRVVSWFRAHTPEGYAARINAALREYVAKAGKREAA